VTSLTLLDVDVHVIPARKTGAGHGIFDLRMLLIVAREQRSVPLRRPRKRAGSGANEMGGR